MKKVIIVAVLAVAVFAVAAKAIVTHPEADGTTLTAMTVTDPGAGGGR